LDYMTSRRLIYQDDQFSSEELEASGVALND